MNIFERQNAYEAEGAAAGLAGKTRADCPYNSEKEPTAWNFWVYGCENAQGELEIFKRGTITFSSTGEDAISFDISVNEAIASGMWKPRYITERSS